MLHKLAEADSQSFNLIQQVQEVFADFQTVNKSLFNLDIKTEKTYPILCNPTAQWSAED
jgi:hypothetical protein